VPKKKTCWGEQQVSYRFDSVFKKSRREFATHDVSDHTHALFFIEDGFPGGHFAKTVGDPVVHKIGLVTGGLELGCFAWVGAVAVAVAALAVPNLFARLDVGGVLHHGSGERGNRFIGRRGRWGIVLGPSTCGETSGSQNR